MIVLGDPIAAGPLHFIQNVIGWWDCSYVSTTLSFVEDLTGSADLTAGGGIITSTINGRACLARNALSGGVFVNTGSSPLSGLTVFGITIVSELVSGDAVHVDTRSGGGSAFSTFTSGGSQFMAATNFPNVGTSPAGAGRRVQYFEVNGASSKYFVNGVQQGTTHNLGAVAAASATIRFMNNFSTNVVTTNNAVRFGEAKVSTGTQTSGDVLAEANALIAKW